MHLTRHQIRSALRGRTDRLSAAAGDALLDAVCQRLALLPDVRWPAIEEARAQLAERGPPSAESLADMLVASCGGLTTAGRPCRRPARYATGVAHGSVVASRSQSQAKRPT